MATADWPAVRWGFIGAGGIARRQMLPAVSGRPWFAAQAVMVRDLSRAEALAAEFGAAAAYDSVAGLLADPLVEAVYIATPPACHEDQTIAAAAAGKHVLVEKPMACNPAACDRMIAACEEAEVRLAVCFPLRYTPVVKLLKRWVSDGELGQVTMLRAQLAKWYPLDPSLWRADPALSGGGVIADLGSHLFDVAVHLCGPVAGLSVATANLVWPVDVEDTATCLLRFEQGALGVVEVSFAVHGSPNAIELYGTEGAAVVTVQGGAGPVRRWQAGQEEEVATGPAVNVYERELHDVSNAIRNGGPTLTDGQDGRVNVGLLAAAYESSQTGCWSTPQ